MMNALSFSYAECSARERLDHLLDPGSFHEWLPPAERLTSPITRSSLPASRQTRRMSSEVVSTGFHTTRAGRASAAFEGEQGCRNAIASTGSSSSRATPNRSTIARSAAARERSHPW